MPPRNEADDHSGQQERPRARGELVDKTLLDEIELLTAVIARAGGHSEHLTPEQVDEVLGVVDRPSGHCV